MTPYRDEDDDGHRQRPRTVNRSRKSVHSMTHRLENARGPGAIRAFLPIHRTSLAAFLSLAAIAVFALLIEPGPAFAQDAGSAAEPPQKTMLDALVDSGPIGLVIILCSIIGVSLAITFAFQIRRDVLVPPDLLEQVQALMEDEDYEEAYHVCEADRSFLGVILSSGLARVGEGYTEMNEAVQDAGDIESTKLHQKVGYLSLIANIAPMLGLFGTVAGMIKTFNTLANSPVQPAPRDLAGGISMALGTTFLGLLVAIPMSVIYVFFRNRVVNVVHEVGAITEELLGRFKQAGA